MQDGEIESSAIFITRKAGEMIRLGDDVYVRVGRIWTSRVSLQIIAPPSVAVFRGELHAAIRKRAAQPRPSGW